MHKYLQSYLDFINNRLEEGKISAEELKNLKEEHLRQIGFMQHERFIHLIVTVLFALMMFISLGIFAASENIMFAVLAILILMPLVPYIAHYYFMENSVQKMYTQYNRMCSIEEDSAVKNIPGACIEMDPNRLSNPGAGS